MAFTLLYTGLNFLRGQFQDTVKGFPPNGRLTILAWSFLSKVVSSSGGWPFRVSWSFDVILVLQVSHRAVEKLLHIIFSSICHVPVPGLQPFPTSKSSFAFDL